MTPARFVARSLIVLALSLPAAGAWARVCDFEVEREVQLGGSAIVIDPDGSAPIEIRDDRLFIDGQAQVLNPSERALIKDYAAQMKVTVPAVAKLTLTSLEIGFETTLRVLDRLRSPASQPSRDPFEALASSLKLQLRDRVDPTRLPAGAIDNLALDAELDSAIAELARHAEPAVVRSAEQGIREPSPTPALAEPRAESTSARVAARSHPTVDRRASNPVTRLERDARRVCAQFERLDLLENWLGRFNVFASDRESV